ncbi:MAG: DEAD/DEAH box helicase, partial [Candidatus Aenigmatarchaeota archaeon]
MVFKKLDPRIQEALNKRGFDKATLPQELGIPEILSGKNVLVIAETGSGKTESVSLPVFDMWLRNKEKLRPVSILYITPLKSLNRDLLKRFLWWGEEIGMEISVRHGDTPQYERKKQTDFPDDMMIITPETLQAILPARKMRENLRNVRWVIIDEVHELVTSKRGVQLTVGLERLRELCGNFQLIALSATVGSPQYVANFISGGRDVKIIFANTGKKIDIKVINPEPNEEDQILSEEILSSLETSARLRTVHELIKKHTSTLVFTNTRDFAEILTSRLKQIYPDTLIENHHSSLSRNVRVEVEEKFRNQEIRGIVATSSLELGIDIGSIDFVLQYMSPRQVSKLLQRVGRAGHTLDKKSEGVIITTDLDDIFESAVIARQALSGEIEPLES